MAACLVEGCRARQSSLALRDVIPVDDMEAAIRADASPHEKVGHVMLAAGTA
jgi:hypothetical protein